MSAERQLLLIADSVELNRAILGETFSRDYVIIEAEEEKAFLEAARARQGQLAAILLGSLPTDGRTLDLLQELKRDGLTEKLPVFLVLQGNADALIAKALPGGAADILSKPLNPAVIRHRVVNAIELFGWRSRPDQQAKDHFLELRQLKENLSLIVDVLSTVIEFRGYDPGRHIQRMNLVVRMLLAEVMEHCPEYGISKDESEVIAAASAMHDIGKITLPDSILLKPGKLTADEFDTMKQHTLRGCQILERISEGRQSKIFAYACDIARHHHEKWDGKGYPDGQRGDEITIWAQVVSLADVYDALTSPRVYKPPFSHEEAARLILSGDCGAFNPKLLACFKRLAGQLAEKLDQLDEEHPAAEAMLPGRKAPVSGHITDRTLRLLELEREKYRVLSELSSDIVFDYDCVNDLIEYSDRYLEIFGGDIRQSGVRGRLFSEELLLSEDEERLRRKIHSLSPQHPFFKTEVRLITAAGVPEWYEIYVKAFYDPDAPETCLSYLGKMTSIDDLKQEMTRWKKQAYTDSLTGLYNRQAVQSMAEPLLMEETSLGVFFIDIDEFKQINDSKGHLYGDRVLQRFGEAIRKRLRTTDIVGRIGGDEFVVILKNVLSKDVLAHKAEELCGVFRELVPDDGSGHRISGSIGIAVYPDDGEQYDVLLRKADLALYCAKSLGKDTYAFYDPERMDESAPSALSEVDSSSPA